MRQIRRFIFAGSLLVALSLSVAAQSYHIRVEYNTNIRAQPSLSAARLETAPAGTVLAVVGKHNRWLKIQRDQAAWMASWVRHERVDAAQSSAIDNCCGIDRRCQSDQEWIDGYYAYQRQECQAPATSSQPSASAPAPAQQSQPAGNNCCGVDRQCYSEQDWINGYWARQNGQCGAPAQVNQSGANCCDTGWNCRREHEKIYGQWAAQHNRCFPTPNSPPRQSFGPYLDHGHIRITELTPGFTTMVNAGFALLRTHSPHWYNFVVNAITEVRECHNCGSGVFGASGITVYHHAPHSVRPYIRQDDYTMAEFLVHEACHVYQNRQGRGVGGDISWLNEYECELYNRDSALEMGGISQNIGHNSVFLNDPMNRALWWWTS